MSKVVPIPIEEDPTISPDVLKFLEYLKAQHLPPFTNKLSATEARKDYNGLNTPDKNPAGVEITRDMQFEQDGQKFKLIIIRPSNDNRKLPAFVFFRGGGFTIFDFGAQQNGVVELVRESGVVAVFVDYGLSPENPYPIAFNEVYAATKWVSDPKNGDRINVDSSRIALVGLSAGGALAVSTAMKMKEYKNIKLLLLISPWLDIDDAKTDSWIMYGEDRFATAAQLDWSTRLYTLNSKPPLPPPYIHNPTLATDEELKGLPRTFLQIAESDPVRDAVVKFGQRLDKVGVKISSVTYHGSVHTVSFINALEHIPISESFALHAAAELKKSLFTTPSDSKAPSVAQ